MSVDPQKRAIDHMNADHLDIVVAFCEKYGNFKTPTNVKMTAINEDGMEISCDQGKIFVPFLAKANQSGEGFRDQIIALYSKLKIEQKAAGKSGDPHGAGDLSARHPHGGMAGSSLHGAGDPHGAMPPHATSAGGSSLEKMQANMANFIDSLKTVVISSLNSQGECVSSYAPFVRDGDDVYFCISSVADHYHSIKANPNNVSLMFLQDESAAKTVLARIRASFKCEVSFIEDETQREEYFDRLADANPDDFAFDEIRKMVDFHIAKATLKQGRFVKGFGAAYNADGMKLTKGLQDQYPHTHK